MTEFEKKCRAMKKKLPLKQYYAWMDAEMDKFWEDRKQKQAIEDSHPQETRRPLTADKQLIAKYQAENGEDDDLTIDDILYEEGIIRPEQYYKYTNSYCNLDSSIVLTPRL